MAINGNIKSNQLLTYTAATLLRPRIELTKKMVLYVQGWDRVAAKLVRK